MARILAIMLFLFKLYFTAIANFSPGFLRGPSARQPAPNTDRLLGIIQVTSADGASSVMAFVSEVRLGTPEHDATFIIAGEYRYHNLHEIYNVSV